MPAGTLISSTHPSVIAAFLDDLDEWQQGNVAEPPAIPVTELKVGMVLASDLFTSAGTKLLQEGNEITPLRLERIRSYEALDGGLAMPLLVRATPLAESTGAVAA